MTAFSSLLSYFARGPNVWHDHAAFFAEYGIAHLSGRACLMARPVSLDWRPEEITGSKTSAHITNLTHRPLTIHIHLATGDLAEIRNIIAAVWPEVETFTYQRNGGKLRIIPRAQLERLTNFKNGIRIHPKAKEASPPNQSAGSHRGGQEDDLVAGQTGQL